MDMDETRMMDILRRIERRLTSLEKQLNECSQQNKQPSYYLDIQHIETLNIEELSYHLDTIDIDELSGTLNIGDTFSGKNASSQPFDKKHKQVRKRQSFNSKKNGKHHYKSKATDTEITVKINGKSVPYKLESKAELDQQEKKKRSQMIHNQTPSLSSTFTIGDIHIGTVEDASAVNFGNNFPTGFRSNKKHNQGFGNIYGDENNIHDIMSKMQETDVVEVVNEHQGEKYPEWLNMLIEEQVKEEDEKDDDE
ncbi:spore germination protein GerPC [Metabacillus iocasae]|uniref:Uncharacterized protein n=1 Tax=Priestia iocasae TaxID=2291674 RepID=A0ABS2QVB7_9BACI|nr:spore germination protein GerPC [Metabacillus iocasae]MBM7703434.1 hypothetical protein [Metabacillus iocasae]